LSKYDRRKVHVCNRRPITKTTIVATPRLRHVSTKIGALSATLAVGHFCHRQATVELSDEIPSFCRHKSDRPAFSFVPAFPHFIVLAFLKGVRHFVAELHTSANMYSYRLLITALAALTGTVTCAPTNVEARQSGGVLNPVLLCPLGGSNTCNLECGLLKEGQVGQCNPQK